MADGTICQQANEALTVWSARWRTGVVWCGEKEMHCRRAAKIRPLVRGQFKTSNYQISNAKWPSLVVSHVNEGHATVTLVFIAPSRDNEVWLVPFFPAMGAYYESCNYLIVSELKELCQISLTWADEHKPPRVCVCVSYVRIVRKMGLEYKVKQPFFR